MDEDLIEKKLDSEDIFSGCLLKVKKDKVELPNGNIAYREWIKHPGASAVIPILPNGEIILVRQYRYPVQAVTLEIPAGKLDIAGENPLECAKRELKEETGITADTWINLGDYYPSVAYTTECITLFLASGLHKGERKLDEDEFLNLEEVPLEDVVQDIMDGKIADGKTIAAILKADKYLSTHTL